MDHKRPSHHVLRSLTILSNGTKSNLTFLSIFSYSVFGVPPPSILLNSISKLNYISKLIFPYWEKIFIYELDQK